MRYIHSLGTLFSHVSSLNSDKLAVHYNNDTSITYSGLERLSNRFAHWLLGKGVERGQVVGIFHDKTPHCFALMLGCLKIGAVYVNLDPDSPLARLTKILTTASPVLLAGDESCSELMDFPYLDVHKASEEAVFQCLPESMPEETFHVLGSDPAYLMFTSGSTGDPKGAVISHDAVMNFIDWSRAEFQISENDILTNLNPMYFDNSVFDFYATLFNGATLAPISAQDLKNPRLAIRAVAHAGCTIWFSVPSLLVYILKMRALEKGDLPQLRAIVFGGEGFPKESLRRLHELFDDSVGLINVYGPTECTCICSAYQVRDEDYANPDLLPLGHIAANFGYHILTDEDCPASPGEVGELCLYGPNVGLGYYCNPEQTSRSFVKDPLLQSYPVTMYRTGDLVFTDQASGLLRFAGRKDNQIKKMGYRIELEEIEVAIGSLAGVAEVGCVYSLDSRSVGRITAFVAGECLHNELLLKELRTLLPNYMIPDQLEIIDGLPKNRNGKVDRRALKRRMKAEEEL